MNQFIYFVEIVRGCGGRVMLRWCDANPPLYLRRINRPHITGKEVRYSLFIYYAIHWACMLVLIFFHNRKLGKEYDDAYVRARLGLTEKDLYLRPYWYLGMFMMLTLHLIFLKDVWGLQMNAFNYFWGPGSASRTVMVGMLPVSIIIYLALGAFTAFVFGLFPILISLLGASIIANNILGWVKVHMASKPTQ